MDPTIFDNLKVVLEGSLYDLDREGRLRVADRADLVDLASMQRLFRMGFVLPQEPRRVYGEVEISSELLDFAAEWKRLHTIEEKPGVRVWLRFTLEHGLLEEAMIRRVHEEMKLRWEASDLSHTLEKTMTPETGQEESRYICTLVFRDKIDEDNAGEIPLLLEHVRKTMIWLDTLRPFSVGEGSSKED